MICHLSYWKQFIQILIPIIRFCHYKIVMYNFTSVFCRLCNKKKIGTTSIKLILFNLLLQIKSKSVNKKRKVPFDQWQYISLQILRSKKTYKLYRRSNFYLICQKSSKDLSVFMVHIALTFNQVLHSLVVIRF